MEGVCEKETVRLDTLPTDIVANICGYLGQSGLSALCLSCKSLHDVVAPLSMKTINRHLFLCVQKDWFGTGTRYLFPTSVFHSIVKEPSLSRRAHSIVITRDPNDVTVFYMKKRKDVTFKVFRTSFRGNLAYELCLVNPEKSRRLECRKPFFIPAFKYVHNSDDIITTYTDRGWPWPNPRDFRYSTYILFHVMKRWYKTSELQFPVDHENDVLLFSVQTFDDFSLFLAMHFVALFTERIAFEFWSYQPPVWCE